MFAEDEIEKAILEDYVTAEDLKVNAQLYIPLSFRCVVCDQPFPLAEVRVVVSSANSTGARRQADEVGLRSLPRSLPLFGRRPKGP